MKNGDENENEQVRGPENEIFCTRPLLLLEALSAKIWEPGRILPDRALPRAASSRSKARKAKKARKARRAARRKNRSS
ncbi:hypothetical protein LCGC14_1036410 [marine sediment metagenome]|uniref:Uncharacterized protein n=1 Tax=marine sediment metagenome TaxID=412755 RepID=A0A0F9MT44_9ZZZZ